MLAISNKTEAQLNRDSIPGEYYLQGVMEIASGFKLNADSSFEFFFSYGALDRSGIGNWSIKERDIIFNSPPHADLGFNLINSKTVDDEMVTIKISDSNHFLLPHVYCALRSGEKISGEISDKRGEIRFPKQLVDSITLGFEFCPEKITRINLNHSNNNYFEFAFSPGIMDVYFNNLVLTPTGNGLKGSLPLLKPGEYNFIKTK